jgi:hypothetical protein
MAAGNRIAVSSTSRRMSYQQRPSKPWKWSVLESDAIIQMGNSGRQGA